MSQKEIERDGIINRVCEGDLKQSQAAEKLKLSVRQVKRLCKSYKQDKTKGLIHKGRGKPRKINR